MGLARRALLQCTAGIEATGKTETQDEAERWVSSRTKVDERPSSTHPNASAVVSQWLTRSSHELDRGLRMAIVSLATRRESDGGNDFDSPVLSHQECLKSG